MAMGPWSLLAAGWMDLPVVFGQRSPSLVYDTGNDVPAHALRTGVVLLGTATRTPAPAATLAERTT